jgi:hypothetical protein
VKQPLVEARVTRPALSKKVRREIFIFMFDEKLTEDLHRRASKKPIRSSIYGMTLLSGCNQFCRL